MLRQNSQKNEHKQLKHRKITQNDIGKYKKPSSDFDYITNYTTPDPVSTRKQPHLLKRQRTLSWIEINNNIKSPRTSKPNFSRREQNRIQSLIETYIQQTNRQNEERKIKFKSLPSQNQVQHLSFSIAMRSLQFKLNKNLTSHRTHPQNRVSQVKKNISIHMFMQKTEKPTKKFSHIFQEFLFANLFGGKRGLRGTWKKAS